MKLEQLLERLEYTCLQGSTDLEITKVEADSRKAEEGSLFICSGRWSYLCSFGGETGNKSDCG